VPARSIEQYACANNVGMNEVLRRIDAAVNMRLGGKIDHPIKLMVSHERVYLIGVGNVGFEKFVAFAMFLDHTIKIGGIAGVSEDIDVAHVGRLVMLQNIPNKVAADESAATGHKNAHSKS
jgi:hypothetical protein